jgi:hypothetical protein
VRQKEPIDGAIENDHLYLLVGFESRDNLIQLRDRFWAEDIQWRDIKRDAPVAWRASRETDLSGLAHVAHLSSGVKIAGSAHAGRFNAVVSIGILRRRFPEAAKIALATAGTMADVPVSPIPLSFRQIADFSDLSAQARR